MHIIEAIYSQCMTVLIFNIAFTFQKFNLGLWKSILLV